MDQKKIGTFIATLRKEKNMTQKVLADKLGVSDRAVSKWENGRGLPDVAFMKQLCKILDITVDELLSGERINKTETELIYENNIFNVLLSRELEIRKRRILRKICFILITVVIIIGSVAALQIFNFIISSVRGEGYSLSTAIYSAKADKVTMLIEDGEYNKAVKYIGFSGQNRENLQKGWTENMDFLDDVIYIENIEVSAIILDDYFPKGTYFVTVYDSKSAARYVFDGQITVQDGGIVFGNVYVAYESKDFRRAEVAELIQTALCTWNAG